jgi:hypothetical protein
VIPSIVQALFGVEIFRKFDEDMPLVHNLFDIHWERGHHQEIRNPHNDTLVPESLNQPSFNPPRRFAKK